MVRLPIQSESMKPRQKTKEQYQAQSEFFGDKVAKDFSESQKVVLKYSNELAKIVSLDALPDDLPEELKKVVKENSLNRIVARLVKLFFIHRI